MSPVSTSVWSFVLERLADPRQLGHAAVAHELLDGHGGLAHRPGGGAVGEDAVGDGSVELVQVGELLEGGGDLGVRHVPKPTRPGAPGARAPARSMVMRIRTALLTAVLCLVPAATAFGAGGGGSSGFGGGGGRRGGGAGGLVGGGALGGPVFLLLILLAVFIFVRARRDPRRPGAQAARRARARGRARLGGRGRRRPGVRRRRGARRGGRALQGGPARLGRARPRPARAARRPGPAGGVAPALAGLRASRLAQPRPAARGAARRVRRPRQPRRRRRRPCRRLHHLRAARLRGHRLAAT